jgi:hypothetical protein
LQVAAACAESQTIFFFETLGMMRMKTSTPHHVSQQRRRK